MTTDPLAAAITDAVIGAGMRVGRNRLQAVVEQAIREHLDERAFAPHCDPSVLHVPGECEHCDKYPDWQAYRETAHIAFTGSEQEGGAMRETREGVYEPGVAPCPSTWFREPQVRDRWPGNRAAVEADLSAEMRTLDRAARALPDDTWAAVRAELEFTGEEEARIAERQGRLRLSLQEAPPAKKRRWLWRR